MAVIRDAILRSQTEPELNVRRVSEQIVSQLAGRDYLSEALAFGHFTEARTRYFRDPRTVEFVKSPHVVCRQILAGEVPQLDCDDMTALVLGLATAGGASTRITCVAFQNVFFEGERQFSHVFGEIQEPRTGLWIVVDPVAGRATQKMLDRVVAARHWAVA